MKRILLAAAIVAIVSIPMYLRAQTDIPTMPIAGTLVNGAGEPVLFANVLLVRTTSRQGATGGGSRILSRGQTDGAGRFELGNVPLRPLEFPLETSMRLEYSVNKDGAQLPIKSIQFSAPRNSYGVTEVLAAIRVE